MTTNWILRQLLRLYPIKRGRWRLFNFAQRRTHGLVVAGDGRGNRLLLDLDNVTDSCIYLGDYEAASIEGLHREAKQRGCSVFVDVGANIGLYAIHFARHDGFERIIAFEPDPANYAQLMGNLFLNRCIDRVEAHQAALGAAPGQLDLNLARLNFPGELGQKRNPSTSSFVYSAERHADGRTVCVPVHRLDDVVQLTGQRVALKIDVEGYEAAALEGMRRTLELNECIVLIEIWSANVGKIDAWFKRHGYAGRRVQVNREDFLYTKVDYVRAGHVSGVNLTQESPNVMSNCHKLA